ncbi:MAG: hypothetical protein KatS3mg099_019 [Candidatus Parcubacteria bacterium]|nr:MAG: hypothetical protein KatS3mg099_019 [Candidatus Parcubacteria bacterium]
MIPVFFLVRMREPRPRSPHTPASNPERDASAALGKQVGVVVRKLVEEMSRANNNTYPFPFTLSEIKYFTPDGLVRALPTTPHEAPMLPPRWLAYGGWHRPQPPSEWDALPEDARQVFCAGEQGGLPV